MTTQTYRPLSDLPPFHAMLPHVSRFISEGAKLIGRSVRSKAGRQSIAVSQVEYYALRNLEKISDIDRSLDSLTLAVEFIRGLSWTPDKAIAHLRYHTENFIIRAIGIDDRAHNLVGACLALDVKRYEGLGGKTYVSKELKKRGHRDIAKALKRVSACVEHLRLPRNTLIHSSQHSDKTLSTFELLAAASLSPGTATWMGTMDFVSLWNLYTAEIIIEYEAVLAKLNKDLIALVDAIGPLHQTVLKSD